MGAKDSGQRSSQKKKELLITVWQWLPQDRGSYSQNEHAVLAVSHTYSGKSSVTGKGVAISVPCIVNEGGIEAGGKYQYRKTTKKLH